MGEKDNPPPEDVLPAVQVAMTDVRRMMAPFFGQGFGDNQKTAFSKTSFDGFDLNDMVDMVEDAKPSDMESVGDALYTAAEKIEQVGVDLGKHIGGVDWQGEAGEAFRKWGGDLANNTKKLGTYTGSASTQIKAAGMGLAMVKSSMPPRDDGGAGPSVKGIKTPARVGTNPDFVKAQKADAAKREATRQEAIIQMDKLSSYYQVSHDTMYAQQEPVFRPMPDVGVPPAPMVSGGPGSEGGGWSNQPTGGNAGSVSASGAGGAGSASGAGAVGSVPEGPGHSGGAVGSGQPGSVAAPSSGVTMPDQQVGTEINNVQAPPAPTGEGAARPVNPTGLGQGMPSPTQMLGPVGNPAPMRPFGSKAPNITGAPRTTGTTGQPNTGRTAPMMGRPVTSGPTTGPVGRPTSPMAPRMGPTNGIIGGTPNRNGPTSGASRIPRGMVIGGDQNGRTPMGRGPMGMGMSPGVPGGGMGGNSPARRLASTPGGIVGTPRTATGGQPGRAFTPGGTGLVRGGNADGRNAIGMAPRGQSPTGRDRERNDSRRPDYLVEDEETWTTGRRDSAPPVVE